MSAVEGAAVVVAMLPDGKIVRTVVNEIRAALRRGAIVMDMSCFDPVATRELAGELLSAGVRMVDAPVSGSVKRAVDGTSAIMVSTLL